jgi:hypothetical protein
MYGPALGNWLGNAADAPLAVMREHFEVPPCP